MATRTDTFDLGALRLTSGEGRHLDLSIVIEPFELGGHTYTVTRSALADDGDSPIELIPATLDISRTTGSGYVLHLQFAATMHGPCMRCLDPADPQFRVNVREVSQPGEEDEEFISPYVMESILDVGAWARDALALALPSALLCKPDCLGLCAICGENLNTAGPEHVHEAEKDPRWAALDELTFEPPAEAALAEEPAAEVTSPDGVTAEAATEDAPESGVEAHTDSE